MVKVHIELARELWGGFGKRLELGRGLVSGECLRTLVLLKHDNLEADVGFARNTVLVISATTTHRLGARLLCRVGTLGDRNNQFSELVGFALALGNDTARQ